MNAVDGSAVETGVDFATVGPALLFCPADRPDRFGKAAERADAVILDLEDAVDPAARPAARQALLAQRLDPRHTIVRVNPFGSSDHVADVEAAFGAGYRTLMLAKSESVAAVRSIESLAAASGITAGVVALCETAAGVLAAPQIAAEPTVVAVMWGAEDLLASLGGSSSRFDDGRYRAVASHARSAVLLAAGAHGTTAIDAVHLDIDDEAGLSAEATDAAACGFAATACIHPAQVAIIRAAYRPDERALQAARELLAAAVGQPGVFRHDGRMIDEPVLRHARALLARA
ncbi:citrate lyase subunit beta/citryl-CoA lyase [Microterricola gilva]|uniref:Citrate lyase subunit beta/citryl-CoA lyase n=1 Tax=Microterricola gilva TaxID=393267 RepID=A0A4V2GAV8_9MICO|nr:CoA ester lyase [Microterricola gilva]RZU65766.1 citrate lyase subunit beta/citryl-CoA lyase [Microterricola gilva]